MRKLALLGLLLLFVFLVGCTVNYESPSYPSNKNVETKKVVDDDGMKFIEERYGRSIYSIDCAKINSQPKLWYNKRLIDGNPYTKFYVRLPLEELNQQKYAFAEGTFSGGSGDTLGNIGCSMGSKVGENLNYLYCQPMEKSAREISDEGVLLSTPTFIVETVWDVDQDKERTTAEAGVYFPEEGARLVSHECKVVFGNN